MTVSSSLKDKTTSMLFDICVSAATNAAVPHRE